MKVGPKINATAFIETPTCIDGTWKIAAVQEHQGDWLGWRWFGEFANSGAARNPIRTMMYATQPKISACQGKQLISGIERTVLYMRTWPGRG